MWAVPSAAGADEAGASAAIASALFAASIPDTAWNAERAAAEEERREAERTGEAYRGLVFPSELLLPPPPGSGLRSMDPAAAEFVPEPEPVVLEPIDPSRMTLGQRMALSSFLERLAAAGCAPASDTAGRCFCEAGGDADAAEAALRAMGLLDSRLGGAPRVAAGGGDDDASPGLVRGSDGVLWLPRGQALAPAARSRLLAKARRVAAAVPRVATGADVAAAFAATRGDDDAQRRRQQSLRQRAQAAGDAAAAARLHAEANAVQAARQAAGAAAVARAEAAAGGAAAAGIAVLVDVHGLTRSEACGLAVRQAGAAGAGGDDERWVCVVAGLGSHSLRQAGGAGTMAAAVAGALEEAGWVALGGDGRLGPRGTGGGLVMCPLWIRARV